MMADHTRDILARHWTINVEKHTRTNISRGLDATYKPTIHLWFCRHLSRQAPQAFCVELSACDIILHSLAGFYDPCVHLGCNSVVAQVSLWNHDSVLSHAVLLALLCTCEDGVETLIATFRGALLCSGNNTIAIRGATFDDGTRPGRNEIVGDALYVRVDTFAFSVK